MNANEQKGLIRGAAIQVAAALAPYSPKESSDRVAREAVQLAIHIVAELEKVEGMEPVIGALDKLKASVAESTGAPSQPLPQGDGHP